MTRDRSKDPIESLIEETKSDLKTVRPNNWGDALDKHSKKLQLVIVASSSSSCLVYVGRTFLVCVGALV